MVFLSARICHRHPCGKDATIAKRHPTQRPTRLTLPWLGKALNYALDPVSFMGSLQVYPGMCYLKSCGFEFHILHDSKLIEEGFFAKARHYNKAPFLNAMESVLGRGLLVAEGEHWRKQRRLVQPAFMPDKVAAHVPMMDQRCQLLMDSWKVPGSLDIDQEMMRLALDVMSHCIFGADISEHATTVKKAVDDISRFFELIIGPLGFIFRNIPSPRRARCLRAARALDVIIFDLIDRAKQSESHAFGLLSRMLSAYGDDFPAQQVRDDLITILLAGHETTALALTYALRLLALNPEAQRRAAEEVKGVSSDVPLASGELAKLPYLRGVILETLRLYPPAWIYGRQAIESHDLGDFTIPEQAIIVACPWWLQRDATHFPNPENFEPERWFGDAIKKLPKGVYAPFGLGPRMCVGQDFAMTEMMVILLRMLQRFTFSGASKQAFALQPAITMRPRHPVRLTVQKVPD